MYLGKRQCHQYDSEKAPSQLRMEQLISLFGMKSLSQPELSISKAKWAKELTILNLDYHTVNMFHIELGTSLYDQ